VVGQIVIRPRAMILAALTLAACNRPISSGRAMPKDVREADRCEFVDAILKHRAADPDDPNARRVPLVEDQCARIAATWRDKLLIEVKTMPGDRNFFSPGERCPMFWPFVGSMDAKDLPPFTMVLELTPDGPDAYHSLVWFRGLKNPSLGTCAPDDGRIERRAGVWTPIDLPPTTRLDWNEKSPAARDNAGVNRQHHVSFSETR
jgi:hypothetical protein